MKVVSVNVSVPKEVRWMGRSISTGIFKEPVVHRVKVERFNIEGDKQADPSVHGGQDKAIYAYAAEHYDAWKKELSGKELPWGMFGENLTIEGGLLEDQIFIGDRFSIGTAEVIAVQPRMPCYKLGIRFDTQHILKKFTTSRRYGVYFRVSKEGHLVVGDHVQKVGENPHRVSIADVGRLLMEDHDDQLLLERASAIEILPENIRTYFQSLL